MTHMDLNSIGMTNVLLFLILLVLLIEAIRH